tara:strand:+ start:2220 stop:3095 length:876 start_codon:yes stop_codon:yes gene_type:complete
MLLIFILFFDIIFGFKNIPLKKTPFVFKMKKSDIQNEIYPRTNNQLNYFEELRNLQNQLVIGIGPAGCGKTYFACQRAIHEYQSKTIKKIVITRPLISVEREEIGFLPGTISEKMDPWTRPIVDVLSDLITKEEVEKMILSNIIELSPLAYMRGRTFKDTFIVADEMQNSSPNQMKMLTTRIGDGSKMIINGDLQQSDYYKNEKNGLYDLIYRVSQFYDPSKYENTDYNKITICNMDKSDVYRSPVVLKILDIYDKKYMSKNSSLSYKNDNNKKFNITHNSYNNENNPFMY